MVVDPLRFEYDIEYAESLVKDVDAILKLLRAKLKMAERSGKDQIVLEGEDYQNAFLLSDRLANAVVNGQEVNSDDTFLGVDELGISAYNVKSDETEFI